MMARALLRDPARVSALESLPAAGAQRCGAKVVSCVVLRDLGLPVPRGLVIAAETRDEAFAAGGLAEAARELYAAFDRGEPEAALETRCQDFARRVRELSLPEALRDALQAGLSELEAPLVLRASPLVPDADWLPDLLPARLPITKRGVVPALLEQWAALAGRKTLVHLLRAGRDPRRAGSAFIVQELVRGDWRGRLWTREPSGREPEQVLWEVSPGGDDAPLEGEQRRGVFRLARGDGRLLAREEEGIAPTDLPAGLGARLVELGRRVEAARGRPQELSWCSRGDAVHLLHSRAVPGLESPGPDRILWTRELSEELAPAPLSPLGGELLAARLAAGAKSFGRSFGLTGFDPGALVRQVDGILYSDERLLELSGAWRWQPLSQARHFAAHLREALACARHLPEALAHPGPFGPRWLVLSRLFAALVFPHLEALRQRWWQTEEELLARIVAAEAIDPRRLSNRALWRHQETLAALAARQAEPAWLLQASRLACAEMLARLQAQGAGEPDPELLAALTAGADSRILAMHLALDELGRRLHVQPELGMFLEAGHWTGLTGMLQADGRSPAAQAWRAFLADHGHLSEGPDLATPTWRERPAQVLALAGLRRNGRRSDVLARRPARRARAREARALLLERLRGVPWLRAFAERLLRVLADLLAMEEDAHCGASRLAPARRRAWLELGRRLQAGGVLEADRDVFFLRPAELREVLAAARPHTRRYQVAARREAHLARAARRPPERLLGSMPLPGRNAPPLGTFSAGRELQGDGLSPGVAAGPLRVVRSLEDAASFRPGEVLVVASPAVAWTPLYGAAAALVSATGSTLSPGMIVAREYGLPAVGGVLDAPRRLETGEQLRVDGGRGTVLRVNR